MRLCVTRLPAGRGRRAAREGMSAPRVLDAARILEAAQILEAELRDVRRRACALEAAHDLLREALRGSRSAA